MTRPGRDDDPDRLYTLTGGRSRADSDAFDLVTLVVSNTEPIPGMQSEHARILGMCRNPTAVVEIAAELRLPVSIVKILLSDLLAAGRITPRHPRDVPRHAAGPASSHPSAPSPHTARPAQPLAPDTRLLEQVLVGLRKL